jgi:hypothetical protein
LLAAISFALSILDNLLILLFFANYIYIHTVHLLDGKVYFSHDFWHLAENYTCYGRHSE